jgi:hypothetical protein
MECGSRSYRLRMSKPCANIKRRRLRPPHSKLLVSDLHDAQPMILLHAALAAHSHPDQLAVALLISLAIVGTSWVWQRRRS